MLRTYDLAGTAEIIITLAQDLGSESLRFCAVVALAFHGGLKKGFQVFEAQGFGLSVCGLVLRVSGLLVLGSPLPFHQRDYSIPICSSFSCLPAATFKPSVPEIVKWEPKFRKPQKQSETVLERRRGTLRPKPRLPKPSKP